MLVRAVLARVVLARAMLAKGCVAKGGASKGVGSGQLQAGWKHKICHPMTRRSGPTLWNALAEHSSTNDTHT